ncbi:MAG: GPW/gp25 family protein [Myxococcaceae bacterium]|nr:GPW/gp25 family protein [Myxococcaceae bacterium]
MPDDPNDRDFLGSGWAFPIGLSGGKVAMVHGEANVRRSIELILGTGLGERVMRPQFGAALQELVFTAQSSAAQQLATHFVRQALDRCEPRIRVDDVQISPDPAREGVLLISIDYTLRARNQRQNLVYPFYVNQG